MSNPKTPDDFLPGGCKRPLWTIGDSDQVKDLKQQLHDALCKQTGYRLANDELRAEVERLRCIEFAAEQLVRAEGWQIDKYDLWEKLVAALEKEARDNDN